MQKALERDTGNKWIAGVCSGLGDYFDMDPLVFRALFLIGFFVFGGGLLIYIILWVIMPEKPQDRNGWQKPYEGKKEGPDRQYGQSDYGGYDT